MKKPLLAIAILLGLAVTMLIAPTAYALDVPPLTMNFDMTVGGWSVKVSSATISWTQAHLKGTVSLTTSLVTIVFQQGSTIKDLKVQGPLEVTLSGLHSFTGTVKIHLTGTAPQLEIIDFQIS